MPAPTLDDLMTRWQQARDQGSPLSPEEVCKESPALLAPLRARIAALEQAVAQLPGTATPARPTPTRTPGTHPEPATTLPSTDAPPDLSFLQPARGPGELGWLGPYRVLSVLSQGGLGILLRGQDGSTKREVILKAMYPDLARDATIRERFLREARNAATLDHPHLADVLLVDEVNGIPFVAMPPLKGEPLARKLVGRPLPPAEVIRLGRDIAVALEAIHVRGLSHRDLKPGNIWLEQPSRRVVLLDYGLTRAVDESPSHARDSRLIGVVAYLAPEQIHTPHQADRRADFFALGCILYEMATGRRAFPGETVMDVLLQIRAEVPPDPLQVNPDLPAELAWLIKSLLQKDPARRPQTARQILNKLDKIEQQLGLPPHEEPKRSRLWLWGLLFALLAALVAGMWFQRSG